MKSVRSRSSSHYSHLVLLLCLMELELFHAAAEDIHTLTPGTVMNDFDYLWSPNELFRLKFFSVGESSNHYLGIEIIKFEKIVWVANRDNPFEDTSGVLNITEDGNLLLSNRHGIRITLNSESPAMSSNTSAILLDSGNLILKAGDQIVWQSSDHPSDTILSAMKLRLFAALNSRQPREHLLTSWISIAIAASGTFTLGVDPNKTNQLVIWLRGKLFWQSGNRNGHNFTYFPASGPFNDLESSNLKFSYISNGNGSYYTYSVPPNYISLFAINPTGEVHFFQGGNNKYSIWYLYCNAGEENGSKGCIDKKPSKCNSGYQFIQKYGYLESWEHLYNFSLALGDFKDMCINNCSCKAYGSLQTDGKGCRFSYDQILRYQNLRNLFTCATTAS
ncbi:G-type lectin S-receptor-like serine/threonine-protein kinase SD1-1 [Ziziphus jujuba]|uniref:G-type lectin S-receptor-like serine/threonine-protein kinase SD1-1 n=1 Tax=Ziziphus jujuba TaxID=326968 RepID=A0ABM3ZZE4_ZIZJJ|nr:G-type lectin S-receptor-like serine/threonine-protein kinase SD1-1 [Ziziphus jujuba]